MSFVYRFRYVILLLTFVVAGLIWYAAATIINNPFAMATPANSWYWLTRLFTDPTIYGGPNGFLYALWTTLLAIFEGFALAVVVGIPVGLIMGRYTLADYALDPWVTAWYSIPAVAFVPLMMNFFGGPGETAAMMVAFLIAVFSIIINVYTGVKNVSASLVEPALSFGAKGSQMFSKILLPAALPNIMVGLRLGISRAIDGVIIAQMLFTVIGVGGFIFDAADKLELGLAVAVIGILAAISIALNESMKYLNKKVVAWKEAAAMVRQ
jgi:ABC-type nitrate/sulfonate/bicarbonate transport system permease component